MATVTDETMRQDVMEAISAMAKAVTRRTENAVSYPQADPANLANVLTALAKYDAVHPKRVATHATVSDE